MPYVELIEYDPTSVIVTFAATISVFPLIAIFLVDPILNQRTTLRDVVALYKGKSILPTKMKNGMLFMRQLMG